MMKIYCSGIGGIGLSAYAALQNAFGHTVSGSDRAQSALTQDLTSQGISVYTQQDGSHVPDDADLFVYSEAIPQDAPERLKAKEYGIRQISYFAALGELSKECTVIAVCGTHGKSTTTAMAAAVLVDAGLDPTVVVGTKVPQLNGRNWRKGDSDIFLLEACEYRGSFLHLHPNIILMTNVDGDHFDAYASLEDYQNAYREFLSKLPKDGTLITHMKDADCCKVAKLHSCTVIDADQFPLPTLSVPGQHMRQNAQLVSALADLLKISAVDSLKKFTGTWRRFELKGQYQIPSADAKAMADKNTEHRVPIIEDYAHHPVEIRATIAAARQAYPDRRIVCLFQPHTHDRTLKLYSEFLFSFDEADLVVTTDIYDARRDTKKEEADIKQFTQDIHTESMYGGALMEAKNLLCCTILQPSDILLVMGAGDVTKVAEQLLNVKSIVDRR